MANRVHGSVPRIACPALAGKPRLNLIPAAEQGLINENQLLKEGELVVRLSAN